MVETIKKESTSSRRAMGIRPTDSEAGQADGAAGGVDGADDHAPRAHGEERPLVDENGGRDAEGDHVGEAVELDAELALRLGHAGDAAVEGVEEVAEEDGDGGSVEL